MNCFASLSGVKRAGRTGIPGGLFSFCSLWYNGAGVYAMFFMIGVTSGKKDLDYRQPATCGACGRYGAYEVFMTYTQLLLFFIPVWKWNRQYFVRMSCCGTVYTLDPAVGEAIARGENPEIRPADLVQVLGTGEVWQGGSTYMPAGYEDREAIRESSAPQNGGTHHRCVICGYETDEDFAFCPKCGQRF
jgi:hypothetical protein